MSLCFEFVIRQYLKYGSSLYRCFRFLQPKMHINPITFPHYQTTTINWIPNHLFPIIPIFKILILKVHPAEPCFILLFGQFFVGCRCRWNHRHPVALTLSSGHHVFKRFFFSLRFRGPSVYYNIKNLICQTKVI